jgi:hypothetical protein
MGSIPASMQLSKDQQDRLFDSFGNIFKSIWSSAKLLGNNLMFNARMAVAAMDGDREKMNQAFKQFAKDRNQFAKESDKNLKYYRQAFYETTTDDDGNTTQKMKLGPALLIGIGNPLLLPVMAYQPGRGFDGKIDAPLDVDSKKKSDVKTTSVASDRLKRALDFFEFGKGSNLDEQRAPAVQAPPAVQQEKVKLQQIAQSYLEGERARGDQLLNMILGRVAFFKKIVESKSAEEFEAAISSAQALGIKMSNKDILSAKSKIEQESKKMMEEKPAEFAAFIQKARAQFPDIDKKDDMKAVSELSFRMMKSNVQQELSKSFEAMIQSAKQAMFLPLDEDVKTQLSTFPLGQQYLSYLTSFEQQLETGEKQIQAPANV